MITQHPSRVLPTEVMRQAWSALWDELLHPEPQDTLPAEHDPGADESRQARATQYQEDDAV